MFGLWIISEGRTVCGNDYDSYDKALDSAHSLMAMDHRISGVYSEADKIVLYEDLPPGPQLTTEWVSPPDRRRYFHEVPLLETLAELGRPWHERGLLVYTERYYANAQLDALAELPDLPPRAKWLPSTVVRHSPRPRYRVDISPGQVVAIRGFYLRKVG